MTDLAKIREFCAERIAHADAIVDQCGVVGGHIEVAQADVARALLALLDSLPPPTSPDRIPPAIRAGLDRYATAGIRPGDCLYAILTNQLFKAFAHADPETRDAMPAIVAYIASELPAGCCGSKDIVEDWIARQRS